MSLPEPLEPVSDAAVQELSTKLAGFVGSDGSCLTPLQDQLGPAVAWLHLLHASVGNNDRHHIIRSLVSAVYAALLAQPHIRLPSLLDSPPLLLLIRGCNSPPGKADTTMQLLRMVLQYKGADKRIGMFARTCGALEAVCTAITATDSSLDSLHRIPLLTAAADVLAWWCDLSDNNAKEIGRHGVPKHALNIISHLIVSEQVQTQLPLVQALTTLTSSCLQSPSCRKQLLAGSAAVRVAWSLLSMQAGSCLPIARTCLRLLSGLLPLEHKYSGVPVHSLAFCLWRMTLLYARAAAAHNTDWTELPWLPQERERAPAGPAFSVVPASTSANDIAKSAVLCMWALIASAHAGQVPALRSWVALPEAPALASPSALMRLYPAAAATAAIAAGPESAGGGVLLASSSDRVVRGPGGAHLNSGRIWPLPPAYPYTLAPALDDANAAAAAAADTAVTAVEASATELPTGAPAACALARLASLLKLEDTGPELPVAGARSPTAAAAAVLTRLAVHSSSTAAYDLCSQGTGIGARVLNVRSGFASIGPPVQPCMAVLHHAIGKLDLVHATPAGGATDWGADAALDSRVAQRAAAHSMPLEQGVAQQGSHAWPDIQVLAPTASGSSSAAAVAPARKGRGGKPPKPARAVGSSKLKARATRGPSSKAKGAGKSGTGKRRVVKRRSTKSADVPVEVLVPNRAPPAAVPAAASAPTSNDAVALPASVSTESACDSASPLAATVRDMMRMAGSRASSSDANALDNSRPCSSGSRPASAHSAPPLSPCGSDDGEGPPGKSGSATARSSSSADGSAAQHCDRATEVLPVAPPHAPGLEAWTHVAHWWPELQLAAYADAMARLDAAAVPQPAGRCAWDTLCILFPHLRATDGKDAAPTESECASNWAWIQIQREDSASALLLWPASSLASPAGATVLQPPVLAVHPLPRTTLLDTFVRPKYPPHVVLSCNAVAAQRAWVLDRHTTPTLWHSAVPPPPTVCEWMVEVPRPVRAALALRARAHAVFRQWIQLAHVDSAQASVTALGTPVWDLHRGVGLRPAAAVQAECATLPLPAPARDLSLALAVSDAYSTAVYNKPGGVQAALPLPLSKLVPLAGACSTPCEPGVDDAPALAAAEHVDLLRVNDEAVAAVQNSAADPEPALSFESRFESGNLRGASRLGPREYNLLLEPDTNCTGHTQWFYFRITGMPCVDEYSAEYSMSICNLEKADSSYNHGMRPLMYVVTDEQGSAADLEAWDAWARASSGAGHAPADDGKRRLWQPVVPGTGWRRAGSDLVYFRNEFSKIKGKAPAPVMLSPEGGDVGSQLANIASQDAAAGDDADSDGSAGSAMPGASDDDSDSHAGACEVEAAVPEAGAPGTCTLPPARQTLYTETWKLRFPPRTRAVFFAYSLPYTFSDLGADVARWEARAAALDAGGDVPITDGASAVASAERELQAPPGQPCPLADWERSPAAARAPPTWRSAIPGGAAWMSGTLVRSVLCHSLAGNPVPLLTVSDFGGTAGLGSPATYAEQAVGPTTPGSAVPVARVLPSRACPLPARGVPLHARPVIVVSARVHPGETNASWMMRGFLDYITSSAASAQALRGSAVIKCVPFLNPDGVINGHHRTNLSGLDLNRCWSEPDPRRTPTVWALKRVLATAARRSQVVIYLDLHGHSRKRNVFAFGCGVNLGSVGALAKSGEAWASWVEKSLPALLAARAPDFAMKGCSFKVQKSKAHCARVAAWRDTPLVNAFTIEASFAGSDGRSYGGVHFAARAYEELGHHLGAALNDLMALYRAVPPAAGIAGLLPRLPAAPCALEGCLSPPISVATQQSCTLGARACDAPLAAEPASYASVARMLPSTPAGMLAEGADGACGVDASAQASPSVADPDTATSPGPSWRSDAGMASSVAAALQAAPAAVSASLSQLGEAAAVRGDHVTAHACTVMSSVAAAREGKSAKGRRAVGGKGRRGGKAKS